MGAEELYTLDSARKKQTEIFKGCCGATLALFHALTMVLVVVFILVQAPLQHILLLPQLVPSAQGKCRVWHTS